MPKASRREAAAQYTRGADSLLLGLLGLFLLSQSCSSSRPAFAQAPAVCVVSGTVLDGGSNPVVGTNVRFRVIAPTLATTGAGLATQDLTTKTAADGTWSLTLVQGLNAQVDIPAVGISKDTVIPSGVSCPAAFSSLTLYTRGTLTPATILSTVGPSMGGDLTGASPNPSVVGLRGQPLAVGNCSNGQARVYSSGSSSFTCQAVTAGAVVTQVAAGTGVTIGGTASVPIVNVTNLPVTAGGTGGTSFSAGVIHGNGTSALTSSAVALGSEVSGQLPIANGGTGAATAANAYNALAPTTTAGDLAYANGAGTNTRVAGNATATRMFFSETTSVPGFGILVAGDIPSLPASILTSGTVNTAQLPSLAGDVTGTVTSNTVTALRGNAVKNAAPSNGNVLTWVTANSDWEPAAPVGAVSSVAGSGGTTGLTLSGGPTGAVTLTLGGTLAVANGGTGASSALAGFNALSPMTTVGDIEYEAAGPTAARLGGNTTTTGMFLHSVGTGAAANPPVWSQVDLTTDVTNTLPVNKGGTGAATLTGILIGNGTSAVTAQAIPLTVPQGGSGATTLTGLLRGNGASAITGSAQASLTTEVTGVLPVANGGTNGLLPIANGGTGQTTAANAFNALAPTTTLGDVIYATGAGTNGRLAGNSSTTTQFYSSTGTGAAAQAPALVTLAAGNIPVLDFSKITTGVVPIAQGGTGQTTASAAFSALDPMTLLGDTMYGGGGGIATALAGNTSATKEFLVQTGNGTISAAPAWGTLVAGDVPSLDASKITTGTLSTGLIPAIAGDVTGAYTGVTVGKIQGRAVAATAPTNGYVLQWVSGNNDWEPQPGGGGGGTITSVNASGGTTGFSFTGGPITTGAGTLTLTGTLGIANGGTGQTTANAGFNALSPMTTLGDVLYGGASGAATRLAGNTTTTPMFLKSTGSAGLATAPAFQQVSASTDLTGTLPVANGGTGATTFSAGYVKSPGGTGILTTQATPIPVTDGGTGAATLTGILSGNGTSAVTGGTLVAMASQVSGQLPVANGGTGAATLTGLLRGTGTTAIGGAAQASLTTEVTGTLPTANGGTNATAWTTGSIPYLSNTTTFNQDNSNLFWDGTNHRLGLGTTSPNTLLDVRGTARFGDDSANNYPADAPRIYASTAVSNVVANYTVTNSGGNGAQFSLRADGTGANSGSIVNNWLGYIGFRGKETDSALFESSSSVQMLAQATETHTSTAHGTQLIFKTTPNGTTTLQPSMIFGQDQSITIVGNVNENTANGAQWISGQSSELLTLSTGGTTTDTSGNLLPANSVIRSVVVRVTAAITVASAFSVGDATIAARFLATGTGLTIGSTGVGLAHVDQTGTSGPRQTAAAKVRVTTTGTPSAGQLRITVFYEQYVAPTS
jgi:hypothetical protein